MHASMTAQPGRRTAANSVQPRSPRQKLKPSAATLPSPSGPACLPAPHPHASLPQHHIRPAALTRCHLLPPGPADEGSPYSRRSGADSSDAGDVELMERVAGGTEMIPNGEAGEQRWHGIAC